MAHEKNLWYKNRDYKHFDYQLCEKKAAKIVLNKNDVAKHSFYPFLSYDQITRRHKRIGKDGQCKEPKSRPIKLAAHADSHIYAYYASLLNCKYEDYILQNDIDECVLAYRKGKGDNIEMALNAVKEIHKRKDCTVIALDLKGFFDSIDHQVLFKNWCKVIGDDKLPQDHYSVYKSITKYSYICTKCCANVLGVCIKRNRPQWTGKRICSPQDFRTKIRANHLIKVNRNSYGIPQGSPISATLSNIYLIEFDKIVNIHIKQFGGIYRRYCDDILLILPESNSVFVESIQQFITGQLKNTGKETQINNDKTVISHFTGNKLTDGQMFQYLGFTFDGNKSFLRSSTVSKYYAKMIRAIKKSKNKANLSDESALYRKKIFFKHSHIGKSCFNKTSKQTGNFFTYLDRAERKFSTFTKAKSGIKKQLRKHMFRIDSEILKKEKNRKI